MRIGNGKLRALQVSLIIGASGALKYYYSNAGADGLRWILAPTAAAVEAFTSTSFTYEGHAGYLSADRTFLIAAPCSGVNFMIIAFLMLTLGKFWRDRPAPLPWLRLLTSAVIAYGYAIAANTVRISGSLVLRSADTGSTGLDFEQLHRLEGIAVYFGFLLLLFFIDEMVAGRSESGCDPSAARLFIPLGLYFGMTLAIPIAGGGYREPQFAEHFVFVITIPLLLVLPAFIYHMAQRPRRYVHRSRTL